MSPFPIFDFRFPINSQCRPAFSAATTKHHSQRMDPPPFPPRSGGENSPHTVARIEPLNQSEPATPSPSPPQKEERAGERRRSGLGGQSMFDVQRWAFDVLSRRSRTKADRRSRVHGEGHGEVVLRAQGAKLPALSALANRQSPIPL